MPVPSPRKKRPRAPQATQDTPMSSSLPDMTGSAQPQGTSAQTASPYVDAYKDLHDRN